MMEEKQYEYRGLAYRMEAIDGRFRFHIPYRNFTSEWYNMANFQGIPLRGAQGRPLVD